MIADLINSSLDVRLITRNVMAVYSSNSEYTDHFIYNLKHSKYMVNDNVVAANEIISAVNKNYNIYKVVYKVASESNNIDLTSFINYMSYLNLERFLWLKFADLSCNTRKLIEILLCLSSNKKILILDYIDQYKFRHKIYSILFHIGLKDKLIIVPFTNIYDAVNNSTCQCYVKHKFAVKIKSEFSNEFLNSELHTSKIYYNGSRPRIYNNTKLVVCPTSYKYSLYDMFMIFLYSLKMLYYTFYNWRHRYVY